MSDNAHGAQCELFEHLIAEQQQDRLAAVCRVGLKTDVTRRVFRQRLVKINVGLGSRLFVLESRSQSPM